MRRMRGDHHEPDSMLNQEIARSFFRRVVERGPHERHAGYAMSQHARPRIEPAFGRTDVRETTGNDLRHPSVTNPLMMRGTRECILTRFSMSSQVAKRLMANR